MREQGKSFDDLLECLPRCIAQTFTVGLMRTRLNRVERVLGEALMVEWDKVEPADSIPPAQVFEQVGCLDVVARS